MSLLSSLYISIWLYMINTLAKYSEIFFDSSTCTFSKLPRNFYKYIFLTLSAFWFDSCKTLYAYLAVVALATISKVTSSIHWWMIVSACWSFLRAFRTTSLWAEVNVAQSIDLSKFFSTVSHTSWKSSQTFTRIHQVS
jgi:hypothetical protein